MIKFIGKINRNQVNELYGAARAGICIYQPAQNHFEAQPIKLFEFMAAGLPVVASNFELWKEIIEENKCGICVDPCNAEDVRSRCEELLKSPDYAQIMGMNGRIAVETKYSWKSEEKKLIYLYNTI